MRTFNILLLCIFTFITVYVLTDQKVECYNCSDEEFNKYTDMGRNFSAYPLHRQECKRVTEKLSNAIDYFRKYSTASCSKEDEGVHLMLIKSEKLFIPTEVLIKCGQFHNKSDRMREVQKFAKRIVQGSVRHKANPSNESTTHMCRDAYDNLVQPLYVTNMCEFGQFMFYKNGQPIMKMSSDFYDINPVTRSYEEVNENLESAMYGNGSETVIDMGCKNTVAKDECVTHMKAKKANGMALVETLYRLHCCCKESYTCGNILDGSMICPYGKLNYNFNQSHVSSEESRSNETIEPSQLNIGEVCYTYVVIRRNVANTDHLSGSITMNYGNNSLKWMSENARDTNERTGCQLIFSKASDHLTDDIEIGCWEKVNEDEAIGWNETVPFHSNTTLRHFYSNGTLFDIFFHVNQSSPNEWRLNSEQMMSEGLLHKCFFSSILIYNSSLHSSIEFCYFVYDPDNRVRLNVRITQGEDKNFDFLGGQTADLDDMRLISRVLDQRSNDVCLRVGGCAKNDQSSTSSCNNVEKLVLICFCRREKLYCDYELLHRLETDSVEYYVPYCNVGEYNSTNKQSGDPSQVFSPKSSSNQFFCFEEVWEMRIDTGRERVHEINVTSQKLGFFNLAEHRQYISNEIDCTRDIDRRCARDGNRFFCCCSAQWYSTKEPPVHQEMCNNGNSVKEKHDQSRRENPRDLSVTIRERALCEGKIMNASSQSIAMLGFGFKVQPLCYFTVPLTATAPDPNKISSYYYDSHNFKGGHRGIFTVLCDQSKWTISEKVNGYNCRITSTLSSRVQGRPKLELSCCSVAHLATKHKEIILKQKNKFILQKFMLPDDE